MWPPEITLNKGHWSNYTGDINIGLSPLKRIESPLKRINDEIVAVQTQNCPDLRWITILAPHGLEKEAQVTGH